MLDTFKLLLPALFPSWRFFDVIGPSPRIELALLAGPDDAGDAWRECRPRPARLGFAGTVKAFFWNARWNETLYLGTCAERLMQSPGEHSTREIRRRLRADLLSGADVGTVPPFFRFRLVFISREAEEERRDVTFVSPPYQTVDPLDR